MSNKQDIILRNADGELHGLCIYYWSNDKVCSRLRLVNGKWEGIDEWYRYDGELVYKCYYINDECVYRECYGSLKKIEFGI